MDTYPTPEALVAFFTSATTPTHEKTARAQHLLAALATANACQQQDHADQIAALRGSLARLESRLDEAQRGRLEIAKGGW